MAGLYQRIAEGYTIATSPPPGPFVGVVEFVYDQYNRVDMPRVQGANNTGTLPGTNLADPDYGNPSDPFSATFSTSNYDSFTSNFFLNTRTTYTEFHRANFFVTETYFIAAGSVGFGSSSSWEYLGFIPASPETGGFPLWHHKYTEQEYHSPIWGKFRFLQDSTNFAVFVGFYQKDPRGTSPAPTQPNPSGADVSARLRIGGAEQGASVTVPRSNGGGGTHTVSRVSKFIRAKSDFLGLTGKGAFEFRSESTYGGEWDWTQAFIEPELHLTTSVEEEYFVLDLSTSLAYDDDAHPEFFATFADLVSNTTSPLLTSLFVAQGDDTYRASYEAMEEAGIPTGTFSFYVRLRDEADLISGSGFVVFIFSGVGRGARFIIRPSNELKSRPKSVLWQHRGEARLWAGETATGNVLVSDNEGGTYTQMANAWAGISGARPLDFDSLGDGGAMSIANVGGTIKFRSSANGINWGTPSDVCPYTAGVWGIREHRASDMGIITVSNMTTKTLQSTDSGATWQEVT